MADIDFDDGGNPRLSAGQVQRLMNMAGAACSVALLFGLGLWGYNLAMRDVTAIPVIRAADGPMRTAPVDPGGEIATHQGMAVNRVAAMVPVSVRPDEVILAPDPVALDPEDAPGLSPLVPEGEAAITPDVQATGDVMAALPEVLDTPPVEDATPVVASTDEAVLLALSVDLEALAAEEPAPVADVIRPRARPGAPLEAVAPAMATTQASVPVAARIDPAALSQGTRLVQLGAFDTETEAQGQWDRLAAQFGDLMSGKAMVVQDATSGGRTFYRLRAHGFEDEADARRFCAALLAESASCIPVAHR
ncbi:MAG: SPOR domain-containing protein [Cypionkella sp.]|jgi:hypothetical protein|nr:SPOR domain-containing protein [Cypionkella sp.]